VYDYVDGKADWMAYGLPVEGDDGPFLGGRARAVTTCPVGATAGEARRVLGGGGGSTVVVVADGLAVGELGIADLDGRADDRPVLDLLQPVPSTVRPSVTVASVADAGGGRRLVTTSDGHLVGAAVVEPEASASEHEDHDEHDHAGHDHDGGPDVEAFERDLIAVMDAVHERFGDSEPSEEELRGFLRERLVAEGRSAEEADRFLAEMG
jgi:hypothetical protein